MHIRQARSTKKIKIKIKNLHRKSLAKFKIHPYLQIRRRSRRRSRPHRTPCLQSAARRAALPPTRPLIPTRTCSSSEPLAPAGSGNTRSLAVAVSLSLN
ncbi:hypothetical protein EUGRSUZ_H03900 [Eucalyptus grandis]|uniref:Uncharacterized protein n=2 Tax=Eucalyptus grandis TaxID=71139 RepID=A0ACC3JUH0_EUCGR|nr:hypothetical protein EUGRSUZ_H03900 [Eucalyptus grandis]